MILDIFSAESKNIENAVQEKIYTSYNSDQSSIFKIVLERGNRIGVALWLFLTLIFFIGSAASLVY